MWWHSEKRKKQLPLVFEGLVARTENTTETGLNTTDCNWTAGCGCPLLWKFWLPVALFFEKFKTGK
jgi:hypothetical protein